MTKSFAKRVWHMSTERLRAMQQEAYHRDKIRVLDLVNEELDLREQQSCEIVDWDEQDRRAYQEELIENFLNER